MPDPGTPKTAHQAQIPRDFAEATALVKSLIANRSFKKERLGEPAVKVALEIIGESAAVSNLTAERLEGVALLGKAAEVSVPISKAVRPLLERALERELPPVDSWGNADDRRYLAKGIGCSRADWIGRYAAVQLAYADIAEKLAREEWANLAIGGSESLADTLLEVAKALAEQLAPLGDPSDLAFRKLIRISEALTLSLAVVDVPPGEGFGKAFLSLVRPVAGGKGAETRKLRHEAANKLLDFLIQILRLRFEARFDSDFYRAAGLIRSWWRPARPPEDVERRADRVAELAVSGLLFLARQGVKDEELRQALASSLGADRINAAATRISSDGRTLDPSLYRWLTTGQELPAAQKNDAVKEANEYATDELLARLLLALNDNAGGGRALTVIAEAIEAFEPSHASTLRSSAGNFELIEQWTTNLAGQRNLVVRERKGEVAHYDPSVHESASLVQRGGQVRVSVPSVAKVISGRPPVVIIKAIVEKI